MASCMAKYKINDKVCLYEREREGRERERERESIKLCSRGNDAGDKVNTA